tara:strand:+ start:7488 stop:8807 length:1320 start_codon:yes stop_codon:yes gene_type:complete
MAFTGQKGSFGDGTDFDLVLKDYYEGPVREHLNNKIPLLKHIEKSKRKWSGRKIVFPVHNGRNFGVGGRGEAGTLPTAGKQAYVESQILSKFLYGRIEISGPVIAASQGDRGSFASALRTEIEGMRRDLRVDFNRQCFGNVIASTGGNKETTGLLAKCAAGVTVPTAGPSTASVTFNSPGTRYLKKGMKLNFGTVTGAVAGEGELTAAVKPLTVDSVTNTTTVVLKNNSGGDITVDAADVAVLGDASANAFNNEITGLEHMLSEDIKLQNLDPSTVTDWKANVQDNPAAAGTNRPLSLELMQLCIDVTDEVAGEEPNLIMGHHSMRREYINLLTSDVRYSPEQLRGGFTKLTYAGGMTPMPIEFDRMAPYNKLYFLNTKDIKMYVVKDWAWADRDGSVLSRVSNTDGWEAFMCWYGNLGLERRFSQTVLADIEVDNLIF